jgi:LuxR family maltose regulon positive regulatory protein
MADETINSTILRTKLHRPPAPGDYVHRARLSDYLDQQLEQPLTLISALAGYGKSTLVSCWLDSCDRPSTWISQDENDTTCVSSFLILSLPLRPFSRMPLLRQALWLMLRPYHPFQL